MRLLVQRTTFATVAVDKHICGQIENGYVVLVGFKEDDDAALIDKMVDKLIHLRIFSDENGKMNRSLLEVNGSVLSISQFTLYASLRHGRRPSFTHASEAEKAEHMYAVFNQCLKEKGIRVETGIFGAHMQVQLINDGPVTIMLDSEEFK